MSKFSRNWFSLAVIFSAFFLCDANSAPIDDAKKLGKIYMVDCYLVLEMASNGEVLPYPSPGHPGWDTIKAYMVLNQVGYSYLIRSLGLKTKDLDKLGQQRARVILSKSIRERVSSYEDCIQNETVKPYLTKAFE